MPNQEYTYEEKLEYLLEQLSKLLESDLRHLREINERLLKPAKQSHLDPMPELTAVARAAAEEVEAVVLRSVRSQWYASYMASIREAMAKGPADQVFKNIGYSITRELALGAMHQVSQSTSYATNAATRAKLSAYGEVVAIILECERG